MAASGGINKSAAKTGVCGALNSWRSVMAACVIAASAAYRQSVAKIARRNNGVAMHGGGNNGISGSDNGGISNETYRNVAAWRQQSAMAKRQWRK
jgi:hypothetical protein